MNNTSTNIWQTFFDNYADKYDDEVFTKATEQETAFLIKELALPKESTILDVGCGTGRHTVALAKAGYKMIGVDLSEGMLARAHHRAEEAGVEIELIHSDATSFTIDRPVDAVVCLCEGAFCLIGLDEDPHEHDRAILRNINAALTPGGKFIMTALSALKMVRQYSQEDVAKGLFDPATTMETHPMEFDTPDGKKTITVREKGYFAFEIQTLLRETGFDIDHLGGGTAGNWGYRPIDLDEYELMVIARKSARP
ncbi:MAG: class I SAM-dependent methyltransferase [candidate division Zixibacteria bacterium]|nr:class I SAM-dependent methyltransferase [candidate division Zixibacteria bacterium]